MLGTSILIVTLIHVSALRLQDESIITARLPRTVLHCFVRVQHSPWPILTPFAWSSSIFNKVTDEKMERSTQNPPWFSLLELTAKVFLLLPRIQGCLALRKGSEMHSMPREAIRCCELTSELSALLRQRVLVFEKRGPQQKTLIFL